MELRKFIATTIREYLNEQEEFKSSLNNRYYHGTRSIIPFKNFDNKMIGSGLVSMGNKYEGFFFTSEKENAEYYAEYFLCEVIINNIEKPQTNSKHPREVIKIALKNKKNYIIEDILDGAYFSDIVVVPKNNLDTINIVKWEFIGGEETLFEQYDNFFGGNINDKDDEDNYDDEGNFMEQFITTDMIDDTLDMIGIDINYLLSIPVFKKYYLGKK
jgi:hypothetical protein